ncbi:unnamed protein product [Linum trigynum]|uniref:Uncharacterized protein n=1 Tax=Linum trigynum TaxID=586398 RepID=A0AAV2GS19_9ROSI
MAGFSVRLVITDNRNVSYRLTAKPVSSTANRKSSVNQQPTGRLPVSCSINRGNRPNGYSEKKEKKRKEKKKRKAAEMGSEDEERSEKSSELGEPMNLKSENKSKKGKKAKVSSGREEEDGEDDDGEVEEMKPEDPNAVTNFRISEPLRMKLKSRGIEVLFPIQARTFNDVLDGCDLVGRARTGQSGRVGGRWSIRGKGMSPPEGGGRWRRVGQEAGGRESGRVHNLFHNLFIIKAIILTEYGLSQTINI